MSRRSATAAVGPGGSRLHRRGEAGRSRKARRGGEARQRSGCGPQLAWGSRRPGEAVTLERAEGITAAHHAEGWWATRATWAQREPEAAACLVVCLFVSLQPCRPTCNVRRQAVAQVQRTLNLRPSPAVLASRARTHARAAGRAGACVGGCEYAWVGVGARACVREALSLLHVYEVFGRHSRDRTTRSTHSSVMAGGYWPTDRALYFGQCGLSRVQRSEGVPRASAALAQGPCSR